MTPDSKLCFVIMPFGEKTDVAGKMVNFDDVYKKFIKLAIEEAGLTPVRCDEVEESGFIHRKMIEHIWAAGVAVVDISLLNPNVFYELGIRHALRESVTILIRRKGTKLPFNIANLNAIEYDETDTQSKKKAKARIIEFIQNGLQTRDNDSLVHEVMDLRIKTKPKPLSRRKVYAYTLRQQPDKSICLITGDIRNVEGIDIWVNSENTNMQMARVYDWSISSVIRYEGAKKDITGDIIEDTIHLELSKIMQGKNSVPEGQVIPTSPGELERTHAVKQLFHVAAVQGEIGGGYRPIDKISACITKALKETDKQKFRDMGVKSILFPLLGVGLGRSDLKEDAHELIEAALSYLIDYPSCQIDKIYFLNWTLEELETCQAVLGSFDELEPPDPQ